jgi:CRP-like cAMP-binding protein
LPLSIIFKSVNIINALISHAQPKGGKEKILDEVKLFDGYPVGLQTRAVREYCETLEFRPGQPILIKDDHTREICIVTSGRAVAKISPELNLTFEAGDFFGELSFIDAMPRSIRVLADKDSDKPTVIAFLSRETLATISKKDQKLAMAILNNLLKCMAMKVREGNKVVQGISREHQLAIASETPGFWDRLAIMFR